MLELREIGQRYGSKEVLRDVTHAFPPGLTLLTGPSGAGKSTLLRLLATAEKPRRGQLCWDGHVVGGRPRALRRTLGYAPQAVDLPEDLTAREFALHVSALKGLELRAADRQFAGVCEAIGIGADAGHKISTFSGGMRRRLVLAQALLGAPRLLVLDEPTSELDVETARAVTAVIAERAREAVVVMTTHLVDELAPRAAAVLRVEAGSVRPLPAVSA